MKFYLGTHKLHWLRLTDIPLLVSHRRIREYKAKPRALGGWILDSGGFSELSLHGEWTFSPREYVQAVYHYQEEIGNLEWAAPMDWMCEPAIIAKTGLSVAEHQKRTVRNFLQLNFMASELPFIPVLQGWTLDDYQRCLELYDKAGINLAGYPRVGVGSVCRRQATAEIHDIFEHLSGQGLKLHGFGVKRDGLVRYHHYMASADSAAWSLNARLEHQATPGCSHKRCQNCIKYAMQWRSRILAKIVD